MYLKFFWFYFLYTHTEEKLFAIRKKKMFLVYKSAIREMKILPVEYNFKTFIPFPALLSLYFLNNDIFKYFV